MVNPCHLESSNEFCSEFNVFWFLSQFEKEKCFHDYLLSFFLFSYSIPAVSVVHLFPRVPANGIAMLVHLWILFGKWCIQQLLYCHPNYHALESHDELVELNQWMVCYTIYRCRPYLYGRAYACWDTIVDCMIYGNMGIEIAFHPYGLSCELINWMLV